MKNQRNSSGASGEPRQRRSWRSWLHSKSVRNLLGYVVVRVVLAIVRLLVED